MESLTRLASESLARHGFDRPLDYRRLSWSRWFRCESHHSLLFVPSKPGVFALAEEIMDLGPTLGHVGAGDSPDQRSEASAPSLDLVSNHQFSPSRTPEAESRKPAATQARRMLAVTQFFEDDDMAFVLDRMLSHQNPMCTRLASGRYFVRFVVVEDQTQRRSICSALNQWMVSAAETATGIGSHFASSLELTPANEYIPGNDAQQLLFADTTDAHVATAAKPALSGVEGAVPRSEASGSSVKPVFTPAPSSPTTPHLDSGAATNIHCPSLPSGF